MNEFAFYSTLLSVGGAWVMEFVAKHIRGPSVDVIRRIHEKVSESAKLLLRR